MHLEDIKAPEVKADFRLWGAGGFQEPAGPFTMDLTPLVRAAGATRTAQTTAASGLRRGGPLVLQTVDPSNGASNPDDTVKLDPMFISASGIDEILVDLKNVDPTIGRVRVTVTDIRNWWAEYGTPVYGRYNILLPNGKIDERTKNPKTKEPWTIFESLDYLACCLPGSPIVAFSRDLKKAAKDLPIPVNMLMRHELPIVWLRKLLDVFRFEPHLSKTSNLFFCRRAGKHSVGTFARFADGDKTSIPTAANFQKRTTFILERPEAAMVVGGLRQRRITEPMVAAFIDTDGQIRRMQDLPSLWGYSLNEALIQALVSSDKAYENIKGPTPRIRLQRIQAAQKFFFKLYAPASLFTLDVAGGVFGPKVGAGVRRFWDFENQKHPQYPALDPWWTPDELKSIGAIARPKPGDKVKVNPKDAALVQTDVVVRAALVRQREWDDVGPLLKHYETWGKDQDELLAYIDAWIAEYRVELARISESAPDWDQLSALDKAAAILDQAADKALEGVGAAADASGGSAGPFTSGELKISRDVAWVREQQRRSKVRTAGLAARIAEQIAALVRRRGEVAKAIQETKNNLTAIVRTVRAYGFAKLWVNLPWGIVDHGEYTFDKENGTLLFNEIAGVMAAPAIDNRENTQLVADGAVAATFGTELDRGDPADMSTWVFMAQKAKDGSPSPPKLCRISEPTNLKVFTIEESDLVVYEDEAGRALNATAAANRAADLAASVVGERDQQDGYSYRYPAYWPLATDESVNQVTWLCDDEGRAWTEITANFPEDTSAGKSLARKLAEEKLTWRARR